MFVLKIILFIAALLFFFIGIAFFSSSDEEIGTPFIILGAAAILALLSFAWFMNWIGGTKRTDEDAAVTKAQESRSSAQYVGVTGAAENEDAPKRRNAQWLFMKEE